MSKFWILLIAILEIIGGIFGIAFVVLQIVAGQTGLVFASVACAVYILSFAAGVALLRNRPFGRVGFDNRAIYSIAEVWLTAFCFHVQFWL
jgi:hypothetical protein